MNTVFEDIYRSAVVPVVTLEDTDKALHLADALLKGGVGTIEIAMRNDSAAACIDAVHREFPEMALGAGTVLTLNQLEAARQAGAKFVVSPGYDDEMVAECGKIAMPIIPGTNCPSDVIKGMKAGLNVIKFFPAEPSGGLKAITFLAAPFKMMRFLPAGGVLQSNYEEYLNSPAIFACAGGFMARSSQIQNGEWDAITAICKDIHAVAQRRLERYPYPF